MPSLWGDTTSTQLNHAQHQAASWGTPGGDNLGPSSGSNKSRIPPSKKKSPGSTAGGWDLETKPCTPLCQTRRTQRGLRGPGRSRAAPPPPAALPEGAVSSNCPQREPGSFAASRHRGASRAPSPASSCRSSPGPPWEAQGARHRADLSTPSKAWRWGGLARLGHLIRYNNFLEVK